MVSTEQTFDTLEQFEFLPIMTCLAILSAANGHKKTKIQGVWHAL